MTPTSSLEHRATERLGSACAGWDKERGRDSILIQSKKPTKKENQSEPPSPPPNTRAPPNPIHIQTQIVSLFSSLLHPHPYIYIYIYIQTISPGPPFFIFFIFYSHAHILYTYIMDGMA